MMERDKHHKGLFWRKILASVVFATSAGLIACSSTTTVGPDVSSDSKVQSGDKAAATASSTMTLPPCLNDELRQYDPSNMLAYPAEGPPFAEWPSKLSRIDASAQFNDGWTRGKAEPSGMVFVPADGIHFLVSSHFIVSDKGAIIRIDEDLNELNRWIIPEASRADDNDLESITHVRGTNEFYVGAEGDSDSDVQNSNRIRRYLFSADTPGDSENPVNFGSMNTAAGEYLEWNIDVVLPPSTEGNGQGATALTYVPQMSGDTDTTQNTPSDRHFYVGDETLGYFAIIRLPVGGTVESPVAETAVYASVPSPFKCGPSDGACGEPLELSALTYDYDSRKILGLWQWPKVEGNNGRSGIERLAVFDPSLVESGSDTNDQNIYLTWFDIPGKVNKVEAVSFDSQCRLLIGQDKVEHDGQPLAFGRIDRFSSRQACPLYSNFDAHPALSPWPFGINGKDKEKTFQTTSREPSGMIFHPDFQKLFIVQDARPSGNGGNVVAMDKEMREEEVVVLDQIDGDTNIDFEGITFDPNTGLVYLLAEGGRPDGAGLTNNIIYEAKYDPDTQQLNPIMIGPEGEERAKKWILSQSDIPVAYVGGNAHGATAITFVPNCYLGAKSSETGIFFLGTEKLTDTPGDEGKIYAVEVDLDADFNADFDSAAASVSLYGAIEGPGGDGILPKPRSYYNADVTTLNFDSKTGYVFAGWKEYETLVVIDPRVIGYPDAYIHSFEMPKNVTDEEGFTIDDSCRAYISEDHLERVAYGRISRFGTLWAPTVSIEVNPTQVQVGQPFTVTVTAHSGNPFSEYNVGLSHLWWFGGFGTNGVPATITTPDDQEISGLRQAFSVTDAFGSADNQETWTVVIDQIGEYKLGANSRDRNYPLNGSMPESMGESHQASEESGVVWTTIRVTDPDAEFLPLPGVDVDSSAPDGLDASMDNCPSVFNPDQADYDKDGIGDVCDTDTDKVGPSDPTNLHFATGVDLVWDAPPEAATETIRYNLYRTDSSTWTNRNNLQRPPVCAWTRLNGETPIEGTTFRDPETPANPGDEFYYHVEAIDEAGNASQMLPIVYNTNASTQSVIEGDLVAFQGSWSDADGVVSHAVWQVQIGNEVVANIPATQEYHSNGVPKRSHSGEYTFIRPGSFTVTYNVLDNEGNWTTSDIIIIHVSTSGGGGHGDSGDGDGNCDDGGVEHIEFDRAGDPRCQ